MLVECRVVPQESSELAQFGSGKWAQSSRRSGNIDECIETYTARLADVIRVQAVLLIGRDHDLMTRRDKLMTS